MKTIVKHGSKVIFWSVALVLVVILNASTVPVSAQEGMYPAKQIDLIVPFRPGGIVDITGRILGEALSAELKVPIIIRNKGGAGGMTGTKAFLGLKPDGSSLLIAPGPALISGVLLTKPPPFDPRTDLVPIGYFCEAALAFTVSGKSPYKTWDDFVQHAKSNPGKVITGFSSVGAEAHLMLLTGIKEAKLDVKTVPFLGSAKLNMALLGGHCELKVATVASTMKYFKSGDMRPILLTKRTALLPDVPSGVEKGLPGVTLNLWLAFFANPEMPKPIYDRLVSAVEKITKSPEVAKKLTALSCDVAYKNPAETSQLLKDQWASIGQVIKESHITK